jgi:hypothetical protein
MLFWLVATQGDQQHEVSGIILPSHEVSTKILSHNPEQLPWLAINPQADRIWSW